jgi:hypothetical protein
MLGAEFRLPHGEEVSRYVLVHGDVVVLTFNLVDQGAPPGGTTPVTIHWNSTEVNRRIDGIGGSSIPIGRKPSLNGAPGTRLERTWQMELKELVTAPPDLLGAISDGRPYRDN